jgi:uncharacterized protein (DUF58 family)
LSSPRDSAPGATSGPGPEFGPKPELGIEAEALGARLPPLMVAALRVAETVSPGAHGRRRVGLGESFWQFRAYQPGDTIDRIDWRQSAKGDRLYIRETEWAAAQTVWLWRDSGPGMTYASARALPTKRARADLLLLAMSALLLRGGEKIGLLGADAQPRSGRGALNTVLAGLQRETPLSAIDRPAARHATLILFSDFLDPIEDIERYLDRIAASGTAAELVQILDPAEMALPFSGRVRFREMVAAASSETDALVPRVEAIRPAYIEALKRQQDSLEMLARSRGWGFMVHGTNEAPEVPLRALHGRLSARIGVSAGVQA